MKTVSIINYGVGNIFSISQALQTNKHCQIRLTNDSGEILNSDYLILPGVGAYGAAMERIREFDLHDAIQDFAKTGKPLLGICLGMQILSELSFEFGNYAGLGLIEGRVEKIENNKFKVPVIGWHRIINSNTDGSSFIEKYNGDYFYFVHSFQFITSREDHTLSKYNYFGSEISAIVKKDNITGVQFHPEKSGYRGLDFFNDFLKS